MNWKRGQQIVRREVLNSGVWLGIGVIVIEDTDDALITYIPNSAPLGFPEGPWPTPTGKHPWSGKSCWQGHGVLMIQKPEEPYAVWHFWNGENREFGCWYLNLQLPFRRTEIGYDTQDLELDFIIRPDLSWEVKDEPLVPVRTEEGRWDKAMGDAILQYGERIKSALQAGDFWWDKSWANWQPDPDWQPQALPVGWDQVAWHPQSRFSNPI